jgi:hypothetical protein
MSPRTLTAPPTDRRMWRRLLAIVHPDRGGDGDLFIWTRNLQEYVAGDDPEPVVDARSSEARERHADDNRNAERIPYEEAFGRAGTFAELTHQAVLFAGEVGEPYASLLRLLADCYEATEADGTLYRQQHQGSTYRQLAYVAHLEGMTSAQRSRWYRIARTIPLSQQHAGHILEQLQRRAA